MVRIVLSHPLVRAISLLAEAGHGVELERLCEGGKNMTAASPPRRTSVK